MNTVNIYGADNMDKKYLAKCLRRLKEWGAPLHGWHCADVVDVREDDPEASLSECELCGCGNVRYEHIMEHEEYFEPVTVGCICAGIMEGDILKAKERERLMRNRAKRRRNFVRKAWKQTSRNTRYRQYKGQLITIVENYGSYAVHAGTKTTLTYKGRVIRDFLSASYAAFDLADPVVKLL
jgi:hypothetical protein